MAAAMREYDEQKVKDCKEDMDTLLVFVSLMMVPENLIDTVHRQDCSLLSYPRSSLRLTPVCERIPSIEWLVR